MTELKKFAIVYCTNWYFFHCKMIIVLLSSVIWVLIYNAFFGWVYFIFLFILYWCCYVKNWLTATLYFWHHQNHEGFWHFSILKRNKLHMLLYPHQVSTLSLTVLLCTWRLKVLFEEWCHYFAPIFLWINSPLANWKYCC